jgi:hypothetical protein
MYKEITELSAGSHKRKATERCLMEAVCERRKGRFTDDPAFVPKELKTFGTLLNDYANDVERQCLIPFVARIGAILPIDASASVIAICKDFLYRRALKAWIGLLGLNIPKHITETSLRELLEEVEDLSTNFEIEDMPSPDTLDEIGALVRATVRPTGAVVAQLQYAEACLVLTICRTAAECVWRKDGKLLERLQKTHDGLMEEQFDVFELVIEEYETNE